MKHIKHWIASTIPDDDNFWKSRKPEYVVLRNCMSFVLRDELGISYPKIGKLFGMEHSTFVTARKKHYHRINSKLSFDRVYVNTYNKLLKTVPKSQHIVSNIPDEDVIILKTMELNRRLVLGA